MPRAFPSAWGNAPAAIPIKFSAQSEAMLSGVDPKLAELMRRVEALHPDAFEITEGMRDRERQAEMVAQGKSQTMNSRHLTGNAVDIALIGPDGKPNWDFEAYRPIADTAKNVATQLGIPDFVWGGDWKTLKDGVHFQVGGPGVAPSQGGQPAAMAAQPAAPQPMGANPAPVVAAPNEQMSVWDKMALVAALKPDQQQIMPIQQPAPQMMPMQRTPYVAPKRDMVDPYLKFFASLGK